MERLTQIDNQGNWRINGLPWSKTYEGKVITKNTREKMYGAFYKLLHYEDTGLDPEQIRELDELYAEKCKELAKYHEAEAQGLLKRLPCKIRDVVYDLIMCDDGKYRIFEMKVCNISEFGSGYNGTLWNMYLEDDYTKAYRSFEDIGNTVFLTRKEAEAKLTEMEKYYVK